jgi:RimJ/RimL family protein N-acetyltransferase
MKPSTTSTTHKFLFKPLLEEDLDLLCRWLDTPHVKEWWHDGLTHDEIKSKYRKRIGDILVSPLIAYLDDQPIGFIQYYHANKVGDGWWPDEKDGTLGIDQFIGEENYINRGFGTLMINAFIKQLFLNPDVKKIITDVDPKNQRAIRCYEKTGFKFIKELNTPDGLAYLMEQKKLR